VTDIAEGGLAESCHDISDGGLATCLVEMMFAAAPDSGPGVRLMHEKQHGEVDQARAARVLLCENGGYVLEVRPESETSVRGILEKRGVWHARIGETTAEPALAIEGIRESPASSGGARDASSGGARDASSGGAEAARFVTIEIPRSELERAWREGATEVMI
jgi:selenophosphate synthetase-related protein